MRYCGKETDTDLPPLFSTETKMLYEEFRHQCRYMEYIPLKVYGAVRSGLSAKRPMQMLFAAEDNDACEYNQLKSSSSCYRPPRQISTEQRQLEGQR